MKCIEDRRAGNRTGLHSDTAGVIAPPPIIYGAAMAAGLLLDAVLPLRVLSRPRALLRLAGGTLAAIGGLASAAVVREFRRASTPVSPIRAAAHIVSAGPYRYSRNPDYIGQMLIYTGVSAGANTWWPLLFLPLVMLTVERGVVEREERYLEAKFGQEYRDYRSRVPRWI